MAGLINLELIKPTQGPRFYLNLYGNRFSRGEVNFHAAQIINKKWSTMSFLHLSHQQFETDVNNDGFRDNPIGTIAALMHRWSFNGKDSEAKFGIKATFSDKLGGQLGSNGNDVTIPSWGASFKAEHVELFGKTGIFLNKRPKASIGIVSQLKYHHMLNTYGLTTYEGTQKKAYLNAIYSDILGNTNHSYKTGASFIIDDYDQTYNGNNFLKTEIVPGAFFEYTFNRNDNFIVVAGLRGDYHNLFGPLVAPRLHAKWNITKKSALRLSTGRGLRVPNPYADFNGFMASNRLWVVDPNIQPEDVISSGVTYTQKFLTFNEVSSITVDYFYTHFLNAFMVDMDYGPHELHIHNSTATAFAHSAQAEISIKPTKGLELRAAFKYYDVQAEFNGEQRSRTFVPKFRTLLNAGYTTRNKKWMFDVTGNFVGKKRLPSLEGNPEEHQRALESETYWLLNSQLTHNFKRFSVYLGGENLLNVIQKNAIIAADDPFGSYFDATQIWAPISGFNIYGGLHFEIDQKEEKKPKNL
jgi:outer membrane cobalamin receptor